MVKQEKIDAERLYRVGEIARRGDRNPNGLGLLPLEYLAVRRRVLSGKIKTTPPKGDKIGKRTFYYIKGLELMRFLK